MNDKEMDMGHLLLSKNGDYFTFVNVINEKGEPRRERKDIPREKIVEMVLAYVRGTSKVLVAV